MKELREVVITGLGAITARGDATLNGQSTLIGQSTLELREGDTPVTANCTIENFALGSYLASSKTYLDRCSALALAGGALALRDAGIEWPTAEEKFGITLGTHLGCLETMKGFWDNATQKGVRLANPILFSHSYLNTPISLCAIEFGLKGYHTTTCAGKYSGLEAVRAAYDAIRLGHADAMLCGGVEAVTPTRVLCEGEKPIGEAAVFFVLESTSHATARAALSTLVLDDTLLNQAVARLAQLENDFADCGGAQSTLALMNALLHIKKS